MADLRTMNNGALDIVKSVQIFNGTSYDPIVAAHTYDGAAWVPYRTSGLLKNGTFDSNIDSWTDWSGPVDLSWDSIGRLTQIAGPGNQQSGAQQTVSGLEIGVTYELTWTAYHNGSGGQQSTRLGISGFPDYTWTTAPSGTHDRTETFVATATTHIIFTNALQPEISCQFDNIGLKKIGGPDLVVNGTFDTDTDWTKATGWTISGGKAHCNTTANAFNLGQAMALKSTETYELSLEISNYVSGQLRVLAYAEGNIINIYAAPQADGVSTHTVRFGADIGSNSELLALQAYNGFVGSVDNVSINRVSY